jgi:hypothetical protein
LSAEQRVAEKGCWGEAENQSGGGRPASVNREREACGRPCSLSFFQREWGGALEKKGGFRVFCCFFLLAKLSLP